jgi:hypothetical protein
MTETSGRLFGPRHLGWRVLAVAVGLGWVLVAWIAVSFLGIASSLYGWAPGTLAFAPGTLAAAALVGLRRGWYVPLAALVLALPLGVAAYATAVPDVGRLRHVAEGVGTEVPGWRLVSADEGGDGWCMEGCTQLTYTYVTPRAPAAVAATARRLLSADGWRRGDAPVIPPGPSSPRVSQQWSRPMYDVSVEVPTDAYPEARMTPSGQPLPAGVTLVYVTYS